MTLLDLIQTVKESGFYPISMVGQADTEENSGDMFAGSIDEYLLAAKALGAKVILLYASEFDEADFSHEITAYDEDQEEMKDDESERVEKVDLTLANPSLSQFKKYVGSDYAFLLSAVSDLMNLDKYLEEDWWQKFKTERDEAIDKVDEDQDAIRDKMEQRSLEKKKHFVKLVKDLVNNPEFVPISTQRGMRAYALEKYPELEEMDNALLREEIQKVSDRVRANVLDKKGR